MNGGVDNLAMAMASAAAVPAELPSELPSELRALAALAERRTTPCGNGEMVWHIWGSARPGVAPLVLLHGGSGSWTHWVRNIDTLVAAGRQVWIPDLPGFGASALPVGGTDADALVEPLSAGLQSLMGGQRTRNWRSAWCWWARRPWGWCRSASLNSRPGAT